jgi:hypothetical protein
VEVGGGFLTTPPIHIRSGKPIRFLIKKNFYNNIMNYIIKHEIMPQSIVGKKKKKKKIFYVHTLPYLPPLTSPHLTSLRPLNPASFPGNCRNPLDVSFEY